MSGLQEAQLQAAYRYCRTLNARHGKTFYLATALLPADRRPHVHALYGFARYADDLVDRPAAGSNPLAELESLQRDVDAAFERGAGTHPVVRAMLATVRRYDIDESLITDFLVSMHTDLMVRRYQTFTDLQAYMWGSASVIGLQMLPILGVTGDREIARTAAADLGIAFQLTNFIRDIGEDYQRGRIYLPLESVAAHEVSEAMFGAPSISPQLRQLLKAEIARARQYYLRAAPGIETLAPSARDCVRTAAELYAAILSEIERLDYQVLSNRATVPRYRRALAGGRGYVGAIRARR